MTARSSAASELLRGDTLARTLARENGSTGVRTLCYDVTTMAKISYCRPPPHRLRKATTPAYRIALVIEQADGMRTRLVLRDVVSIETSFLEAPLEFSDSIRVEANVCDAAKIGGPPDWRPVMEHEAEDLISDFAQVFGAETKD